MSDGTRRTAWFATWLAALALCGAFVAQSLRIGSDLRLFLRCEFSRGVGMAAEQRINPLVVTGGAGGDQLRAHRAAFHEQLKDGLMAALACDVVSPVRRVVLE